MDRLGGIGEGVLALDSNSLSRSETSVNLLRAIWEGVSAILTIFQIASQYFLLNRESILLSINV